MPYRDPNELIALGRTQMPPLFRPWFRQLDMTQPKWLRIASSLFAGEERNLHSSQIGGLSSGKLGTPSPKCLLVIGQLNLAVARSAGYEVPDGTPALPESLRSTWQGLLPMLGPDGRPLGPVELFQVACGLLDLHIDTSRDIPAASEAAACATLGRHIRLALAAQGRDFMSEMPELRAACPTLEPLLMGQPLNGDALVGALPTMAATVGTTEADLWAVVAEAIASPTAPR